ncbi:hypothetical protein T10_6031 [Trichinella papuae]|uniref:Uncharacterized protein n=1 Tax=Trichinella papuae TaxID=268474 RepID=A0A0V1M474_9BILA|nr:hypothetical protein T10_6031 [Trichinella papuae]
MFPVQLITAVLQYIVTLSIAAGKRSHYTFKHPFAAKHHCQMKRHAECWRATTKDDNLTALDQENMVGVAELPNRTSESEFLSDEHCPIEQAHRDIEIRSLLLDFQVQCVAFAEKYPICWANSRVDWCGSLCMSSFNRSSLNWTSLPERGESVTSNLPFLRRENHICAVLSEIAPSLYTEQISRAALLPLEP